MVRRFEDRQTNTVAVVKLGKSGGCVDRDEAFLKQSRERAIKEYFFGEAKRTLSPYTMAVGFDDLNIWRVGEGLLDFSPPLFSFWLNCGERGA